MYPKASAFIHIVFLTLSKPFQVPQSISIHPYCVPYIIEAISSTPKHQYSSILCSLHYRSHFKYPKASAVTNTVCHTLSKPFQVPQSISIHPYCVPYIIEAISSTPKHQQSPILYAIHYRSHFKYPKASVFIHIVFLTLSKPFQVPQSISIHPYCVPYIIEAISSTPKHQHSSILLYSI